MTQPVALGYIRVHIVMTEFELNDAEARIRRAATENGYQLGAVFHEQAHLAPKAFAAMIAAVNRREAAAVIVPSLIHLAVLGLPTQVVVYLESVTDVRVIVADPKLYG